MIPSKRFMKACVWRRYRTGSPVLVFWNEFCATAWLAYFRVSQMPSRSLFMFRAFPDRRGVAKEIFI